MLLVLLLLPLDPPPGGVGDAAAAASIFKTAYNINNNNGVSGLDVHHKIDRPMVVWRGRCSSAMIFILTFLQNFELSGPQKIK